ncbi:MAG TPA: protein-glutamate O-methyltransferase CheR [Thermodesulfobacteriota bacterium]|nr:protein-glutamate O-methyltransferase CheR [Thermodesulfobacteriota bacterium]
MNVASRVNAGRAGTAGDAGVAETPETGAAGRTRRRAPARAGRLPAEPGPRIDDAAWARVAAVLRAARGLDLAAYKDGCVRRRIALRARARGCADGAAYAALLERDRDEVERLAAALAITVSQFFRDPGTFERIGRDVLPALLAGPARHGLRCVSVGCAGGEEPYSLAILLRERFADRLRAGRVSILGLDLDAAALARARAAVYGADRLAPLPAPLKARYFVRTPEGRYALAREVRRMVTFRQANVLDADALPAGPIHLILCRNVLMYFTRAEQQRLLASFEDRLAPGGFLVLGRAETLLAADRRRFETVCPWERIYRRP